MNSVGEGVPGVLSHLQVVSYCSTKFGRFCVTLGSFTHPKLTSHGFKKGDNVSIFRGGALCRQVDHCINGVLFDVNTLNITITIDDKIDFSETDSYSVKHFPTVENVKRMLQALKEMETTTGPCEHLAAVIFQETSPREPIDRLPPRICRLQANVPNLFNSK